MVLCSSWSWSLTKSRNNLAFLQSAFGSTRTVRLFWGTWQTLLVDSMFMYQTKWIAFIFLHLWGSGHKFPHNRNLPADLTTKAVSAFQLLNSMGLTWTPQETLMESLFEPLLCFPLMDLHNDSEISPNVKCTKVQIDYVKPVNHKIRSTKFLRFSKW